MMADQTIARVEPVRTEAYLDFLQMLTGVGLVAFMWCHMILVASVNLDLGGGRVMNAIAHFFEATYMAQIGGPMIALTMLAAFCAGGPQASLSVPVSRRQCGGTPSILTTPIPGCGSFRR